MMCISLFSSGRPLLLFDVWVRLGMGWVGSWVHKSIIWWVRLGWVDENRPTDNSAWGLRLYTAALGSRYTSHGVCVMVTILRHQIPWRMYALH